MNATHSKIFVGIECRNTFLMTYNNTSIYKRQEEYNQTKMMKLVSYNASLINTLPQYIQ